PLGRQPRELPGEPLSIEQHIVGAVRHLNSVVLFEDRLAVLGGEDQIALLAEAHIGVRSEFLLEMAQNVEPEFRQADILRRRELLADTAATAGGAAIGIAGVALDQRDRTLEALFLEEIGGTASDDAAADDHNIISLHGAALCPKTDALSSLSCHPQAWQI